LANASVSVSLYPFCSAFGLFSGSILKTGLLPGSKIEEVFLWHKSTLLFLSELGEDLPLWLNLIDIARVLVQSCFSRTSWSCFCRFLVLQSEFNFSVERLGE